MCQIGFSTCHLPNNQRKLILVCGVGFAFLLIFSAFNAASQATESVLEEARREKGHSFTASGYVSLAIIYGACAVFNWISPLIVSYLQPKWAMFIGSLTYLFFLVTFFEPVTWIIYVASVIIGCGAAVIWTAQGVYVTACSTETSPNRNFGLFWMIFSISNILGGCFSYFQLSDITSIASHFRHSLYGAFTAICALGCISLLVLPKPKMKHHNSSENGAQEAESGSMVPRQRNRQSLETVKSTIVASLRLCKSPVMLAILLATCFTGLNLTFYSGVYGTCLSRMKVFGKNAKSYIGLSGIFIGVGEVIGGLLSTLGSSRIRPVFFMIFGFLSAILSAILAFLMIPSEAPIHETPMVSYIEPTVYVAMLIAALLGLSDTLWATQICAIIGKIYPTDVDPVVTAAAFALFKFIQSVTSAVAFSYSLDLFLHWQLLIFVIFAMLGLGGFLFANRYPYSPTASEPL